LAQLFALTGRVKNILFNDETTKEAFNAWAKEEGLDVEMIWYEEHDDHFHLNFKDEYRGVSSGKSASDTIFEKAESNSYNPSFEERIKNVETIHGVDDVLIEQVLLKLVNDYGFTEQGAAWFTGALIWESGLDPSITGDGGKALGIAQWHEARRTGSFPHGDFWGQLQYAVNEMKNNYPKAYNIYTDPFASDADLSDANKNYEGYGKKGQRDVIGNQLEEMIKVTDGTD
jgi:hypothetical protein